jgi:hypothetical protein
VDEVAEGSGVVVDVDVDAVVGAGGLGPGEVVDVGHAVVEVLEDLGAVVDVVGVDVDVVVVVDGAPGQGVVVDGIGRGDGVDGAVVVVGPRCTGVVEPG